MKVCGGRSCTSLEHADASLENTMSLMDLYGMAQQEPQGQAQ